MIKVCIFDLDGTIADTLESMAYVANEIMEKFSLKPQPTDNFRYYSGEGADMLIRRCLIDAGDPELVHYEEVRELYRRKFDEDPLYKVVPYKDMPETLQKLKHAGLKMAVCSNKPHIAAQKVVKAIYGDLFDEVMGQQEGIRRKPAPDGPLKIAGDFGVKPEDITSKKRNSEFVQPRQVVMYLCRELTDTSFTNIGKLLGKKDHTTIIHGVNKVSAEIQTNEELRNKIDIITKKINPS